MKVTLLLLLGLVLVIMSSLSVEGLECYTCMEEETSSQPLHDGPPGNSTSSKFGPEYYFMFSEAPCSEFNKDTQDVVPEYSSLCPSSLVGTNPVCISSKVEGRGCAKMDRYLPAPGSCKDGVCVCDKNLCNGVKKRGTGKGRKRSTTTTATTMVNATNGWNIETTITGKGVTSRSDLVAILSLGLTYLLAVTACRDGN